MKIYSVQEPSFQPYGRVLADKKDSRVAQLLQVLRDLPVTQEVVYAASDPLLEELAVAGWLQEEVFGGMPVQLGWCNGYNRQMNAMEYHKSSEVNLAGTDLILMLGCVQDLETDFTYDTAKAKVFFVPCGTLIEVYGTSLHYAPCHVEEKGFQSLVALPKGTNTSIAACGPSAQGEAKLLFAKNKWLVGHPEAGLEAGVFLGLKGENIKLDE